MKDPLVDLMVHPFFLFSLFFVPNLYKQKTNRPLGLKCKIPTSKLYVPKNQKKKRKRTFTELAMKPTI